MITLKEEGIDPILWEEYRKWLLKKAWFEHDNYVKLTSYLHNTDHTYVIETNPDRLATGFTTLWDRGGSLDVRDQFNDCSGSSLKFPDYRKNYLTMKGVDEHISCSVLEEMVRMAFSVEEREMYIWIKDNDDPRVKAYRERGGRCYDLGIRIDEGPHLFELFLINLGLMKYDDSSFSGNEDLVDFIVQRWLKRQFDYDGTGGVVPVPGTDRDQRFVPLSSQISEYANIFTYGYCWLPVPRHERFNCGRR